MFIYYCVLAYRAYSVLNSVSSCAVIVKTSGDPRAELRTRWGFVCRTRWLPFGSIRLQNPSFLCIQRKTLPTQLTRHPVHTSGKAAETQQQLRDWCGGNRPDTGSSYRRGMLQGSSQPLLPCIYIKTQPWNNTNLKKKKGSSAPQVVYLQINKSTSLSIFAQNEVAHWFTMYARIQCNCGLQCMHVYKLNIWIDFWL